MYFSFSYIVSPSLLSSLSFLFFYFAILLYSSLSKSWLEGVGGGVQHDELPLESRLKYSHHQLSRRLSEKEVFAFSLAAANRVSPPLCLRPSPPFPRSPSSQWEAVNAPSAGQSANSCYVGGRIDKRRVFFPPLFFFTSSHYSWLVGCRQETLLPAKHHGGYGLNH